MHVFVELEQFDRHVDKLRCCGELIDRVSSFSSTIDRGHELGELSFIAAGAVETDDVPAHAQMTEVPVHHIAWSSKAKLGSNLVDPTWERYSEKR